MLIDVGCVELAPVGAFAERGFSCRWFDESPRPQDRFDTKGLYTSYLSVLNGEAEVGYMAVGFTTEEAVACMRDNFWVFMHEWRGWSVMRDGRVDWVSAHVYARSIPVSQRGVVDRPGALSRDRLPAREVMDADLAALQAKLAREDTYDPVKSMASHLIPYVAFSRISDPYRGHGLGEALYEQAARRLAADGRLLAASVSRTPEAVRLWDRLKRRGYPVVSVERHGAQLPALDYRASGT